MRTFLTKFGSQGGGEGQFFDPEAIAVDHNGNIFVADSLAAGRDAALPGLLDRLAALK